MTRPQLSVYRPAEPTATCGHEDHASPTPATMHLWLRANREDNTALACAEHLPVARRAGRLVMEHQVGPQCEMPGTAWDQANNTCMVDDTAGGEGP